VVPGVAGCAVWPGITRLGMAGRGWVTVTVGSQLGSQLGFPSHRLTRRTAAARRSSRDCKRYRRPRRQAAPERLGDNPAAGTALIGRALTSFDPDGSGIRLQARLGGVFGRAGQGQQARIAPGLMTWAGGGRISRGTHDLSLGKGQGHAVSEWQPKAEQRPGHVAGDPGCSRRGGPGRPRFAGAVGRHRCRRGIMNTAVLVCRGRWACG
jgi:hypothetical protein